MNSPFKFLDAYQKEDLDIFFGREKETETLYQALSGVKHLLVYGASGTGKTSLIECGLRNQFSDADWFALSIRKRNNINESVLQAINEALEEKLENVNDFEQAVENLFAERYQPIYLLFDQFEELLILGEQAEKEEFFNRLNRLIKHKVPCRVMLIMREEFIGHLSEFEHLCPSIFQYRFRLEKMNKSHVKEVIEKTLTAPQYQNNFEINENDALIEAILACLPDEKKEIELAHVQVFLNQLWERAYAQKTSEKPILIPALVKEDDRLESVLNNFLTTQLADLDQSYGKNVTLELLAVMISEKHTKLQVEEKEVEKDLAQKQISPQKPLKELLKDLERRRLLRTIKANEQTQYEISHDLLARAVGQNLTQEMKMREKAQDIYKVLLEKQGYYSQEDLDLVRPYQKYAKYSAELRRRVESSEIYIKKQQVAELAKEKRQLRKVFILTFFVIVGLGGAVSFGLYASFQRDLAEKNLFRAAVMAQHMQEKPLFEEIAPPYDVEGLDTTSKSFSFDEILYEKIDSLDFSGRNINAIPQEVFLCTNLRTLDLYGNKLTSLSTQINKLKNLKTLNLGANEVSSFPTQLWELKNLTTLNLEYNKLTALSAQIRELKNLTTLNLHDTQLETLPTQIGELKNLTTLSLSSNPSMTLPTQIGELKNLTTLNLNENQLETLPTQLWELKSLTTLNLSYNKLKDLPTQIRELKNLTTLNLYENQLETLPTQIGELKNLTWLNFSNNQLTTLPTQIGELKNLMTLYLVNNQLTTLPTQIGELKNLTTLNLYGNPNLSLASLCVILSNHKKNIRLITADAFLNYNKEILLINIPKQSNLPVQIGKVKNLTELDLSYNQLTTLPDQIGELKNLTTLYLGYNQFTTLPAQMRELKSLKNFSLSGNPLSISEINKALAFLPSLEEVYLKNFGLTTLPESVLGLKNLKKLDLKNNDEYEKNPNNFSAAEQEKIRKLLPNCKVEF